MDSLLDHCKDGGNVGRFLALLAKAHGQHGSQIHLLHVKFPVLMSNDLFTISADAWAPYCQN